MSNKMDIRTQKKWDKASERYDTMAGAGGERRWAPAKQQLFSNMQGGKILFLALGTGLDIPSFPEGQTIEAIDISQKMLDVAAPRIDEYSGNINAQAMDVHNLSFDDNTFDQVYTSCTFCSVPNPIEGLRSLKRVLKPGAELFMFEHTGSRYYPFKPMMNLMTTLTKRIGPDMNRPTVSNVVAAGFEIAEVNHVFLDVVKTIRARKPNV